MMIKKNSLGSITEFPSHTLCLLCQHTSAVCRSTAAPSSGQLANRNGWQLLCSTGAAPPTAAADTSPKVTTCKRQLDTTCICLM